MATMTTTAKTRGLTVINTYANGAVLVYVRVGVEVDTYYMAPAVAERGRGYEVVKFGGDTYHLTIEDDGATCQCKGFRYGGTCRHIAAVVALRNRGYLHTH